MYQPLPSTSRPRIVRIDTVRLVAFLMLVCCHCGDSFNFCPFPTPQLEQIKLWGAVWGSAVRPCVPLFVMMTGALLLPVRQAAVPFCKKRIGRVLWPFLIWSAVYALFPWLTGVAGLDADVIQAVFPYNGDAVGSQAWATSAAYLALRSRFY